MKMITVSTETPKLKIEHDNFCDSPRMDSNLGYFITISHLQSSPDVKYDIINIVKSTQYAQDVEHQMELITKKFKQDLDEEVLHIFPVSRYTHGNSKFYLGTNHGFDWSNNGFYIVTKKSLDLIGTPNELEAITNMVKGELEAYNTWINGEILAFTLYDDLGEVEDSSTGFYDIEDIKEHLGEEWNGEDLSQYIVLD
jgi:hypothetical protein